MNWLKLKLLSFWVGDTVPVAESIWYQLQHFNEAAADFKLKLDYLYIGETHVHIIPAKYGLSPNGQQLLIKYLKLRGYSVGSPVVNKDGREEYSVEVPDYFRRKACLTHPDKRGEPPPASRNSESYLPLKCSSGGIVPLKINNEEISPPLPGEHIIRKLSPAPELVVKITQKDLSTGTYTVSVGGNDYRLVPLTEGNTKNCVDVGTQPPSPTKPYKGYQMSNKLVHTSYEE